MAEQVELRVAAVAAPQWSAKPAGTLLRSLTAADPFSLQNAMRLAAHRAQEGIGVWATSTLDTPDKAATAVSLFEHWENERERFERLIAEERPHILFIGAMTLCFRGAIEMARHAKEMLGNQVLVVLGGKHCNETIISAAGQDVDHLRCSPAQLMEDRESLLLVDDRPIFDLVCTGEGEDLIYQLGNAVGAALRRGKAPVELGLTWPEILHEARGHWTVTRIIDGQTETLRSRGLPLDWSSVPTAAETFGVHSNFAVFGATRTGHAYSDMGLGCHFNCYFCSERRAVSGPLRAEHEAASRLLRHFTAISTAVRSADRFAKPSAFVEDSIFLGGSAPVMSDFCELLRIAQTTTLPLFPFGIQLTVDDVLRPPVQAVLKQLREVGLTYVAIGIETEVDAIARTMSKNRGKARWTDRVSRSIETLTGLGIGSGVFVLWGLGESQQDRLGQLEHLRLLRNDFSGQPGVISLNLAVQHPLGDARNIPANNFLEWGTRADSEYLPLLIELFGEASENYGLLDEPNRLSRRPPRISELKELRSAFDGLGKLMNGGRSDLSPVAAKTDDTSTRLPTPHRNGFDHKKHRAAAAQIINPTAALGI